MLLAALLSLLTAHASPATCYTAQDLRDAECRERCRAELHNDGLWIRGGCFCSMRPLRLGLPGKRRTQPEYTTE